MLKFRNAKRDALNLACLLRDGSDVNLETAISVHGKQKNRPLAKLLHSGLEAFTTAPAAMSDQDAIELAQRAMRRCSLSRSTQMKVGLSALATIASLAPFFGLVGTTVALLNSFRGGSNTPTGWLVYYATSLSLALVPTALGLLVGVVAVALHNHLITRLAVFNVDSTG